MFAKKKIVLNSAVNDNKKGMAILTRLDNLTHLQIKIANYAPNKNSSYIFLLKNNGIQQRFIVNDPREFETQVEIPIDLENKISCLLIENGAQQTPIFWGGTQTQSDTIKSLDSQETTNFTQSNNLGDSQSDAQNVDSYDNSSIDKFSKQSSQNQQDNLVLHKLDGEELFVEGDIEKEIDNCMQFELVEDDLLEHNFPQCANCKYKDVFYKEKQLQQAKEQLQAIAELQKQELAVNESDTNATENQYINDNIAIFSSNTETEINENAEHNTDNNATQMPYYYSLIQSQYEDMFSKYPAFEKLSKIIDNSKWIMVDAIDEPYIMGIIYENSKPKYLCYGVIQDKKQTPPIELMQSSQWVPFDINNEFGQGAYIMYQSAENGETLTVEVC